MAWGSGTLDVLTRPGDSPETSSLLACNAPLGPGRVSNDLDSERGIVMRKGLRFDIFRRDSFTCRYCGAQPPDVVLEVDHVVPRVDGGTDDPLNLVTSCGDCNRGKSRKRLDPSAPVQPDADLEYLAVQQELAEIERYQHTLALREEALKGLVNSLQDLWMEVSELDWYPKDRLIRSMLLKYDVESVEAAIRETAPKITSGFFGTAAMDMGRGDNWLKYMWAVARNQDGD